MSATKSHRTPPRYRCERCGAPFRGYCDNSNRFCSRACWYGMARDRPELPQMRALWDAGLSAAAIGRQMGIGKNVVTNLAHRNGFPARPSPIKRP